MRSREPQTTTDYLFNSTNAGKLAEQIVLYWRKRGWNVRAWVELDEHDICVINSDLDTRGLPQ